MAVVFETHKESIVIQIINFQTRLKLKCSRSSCWPGLPDVSDCEIMTA